MRVTGDWTRRLAKAFTESRTPEVESSQAADQQLETQHDSLSDLERDNPAFVIDVDEPEMGIEGDQEGTMDSSPSSEARTAVNEMHRLVKNDAYQNVIHEDWSESV